MGIIRSFSYGAARHGGYVYYERAGMERKCFFESMATTTMHLIHHDGVVGLEANSVFLFWGGSLLGIVD